MSPGPCPIQKQAHVQKTFPRHSFVICVPTQVLHVTFDTSSEIQLQVDNLYWEDFYEKFVFDIYDVMHNWVLKMLEVQHWFLN